MIAGWATPKQQGGAMRPVLAISLLFFSLLGLVSGEENSKLVNVKRIYIGDLVREEGSDLVREKIRVRLMKSGRFVVVAKPEAADTVLTGVAGVARLFQLR
jgi:hypothetical protein